MSLKATSIRLDEVMHEKLLAIASYEARSLNGQIMVLVRDCIAEFEQKHGELHIAKTSND